MSAVFIGVTLLFAGYFGACLRAACAWSFGWTSEKEEQHKHLKPYYCGGSDAPNGHICSVEAR